MVVEVIQKSWLPGNTGLIGKYYKKREKIIQIGKEKYKEAPPYGKTNDFYVIGGRESYFRLAINIYMIYIPVTFTVYRFQMQIS